MTASYPRLYIGALILDSTDNALLGAAAIDTNGYPEPIDAAAVKRLAANITERDQWKGDLPAGQYYVIVSWQRYGTGGTS